MNSTNLASKKEALASSKFIKEEEAMTFDDVLLVPQFSNIEHRADVNTRTKVLPTLEIDLPLISANMDTITEYKMAFAMAEEGGLGILHRYLSIEAMCDQIDKYNELAKEANVKTPFVVSIGVHDKDRTQAAYDKGIRHLCIDVAHGHHSLVQKTIEYIRSEYGNEMEIIAGNVCTYEAAYDLFSWGADCVKVGIGPGSVCTTRIKTGCGFPQLTATMSAAQAKKDFMEENPGSEKFVIADGGIKHYGDVSKAIASGADVVMMGSMFAGCKQTPGIVCRNEKGEMIKSFRGMASASAQSDFGIEDVNEEGIALNVKYKGNINHLLKRIIKGLRSGMSYCGARDIKTMQEVSRFIKVSTSGNLEGHAHKAFGN